jgi:hypothetical protein
VKTYDIIIKEEVEYRFTVRAKDLTDAENKGEAQFLAMPLAKKIEHSKIVERHVFTHYTVGRKING